MTNYTKMTLLSAALAAFLLPATAQTGAPAGNGGATTPPPVSTAPVQTQTGPETGKEVQERKEKQQDRIANGIGNGSLTSNESSALEKKETQINQEERDMKSMDNGHLTAADRATLQQQQNQVSKQITADKHNASVQNPNPTTGFGKRRENQQDRIAQGVKSGQLTAGETNQLESKEAHISQEVQKDRAANGGTMTTAERQQVKQQQRQLSKQIHKDKHNGRHQ